MNEHNYISTACHHELHERCRKQCKFCESECRCKCHDTTRRLLRGLLARIHGDGGHYTAEHGINKSVEDADQKVISWLAEQDCLLESKQMHEVLRNQFKGALNRLDELEAYNDTTEQGIQKIVAELSEYKRFSESVFGDGLLKALMLLNRNEKGEPL